MRTVRVRFIAILLLALYALRTISPGGCPACVKNTSLAAAATPVGILALAALEVVIVEVDLETVEQSECGYQTGFVPINEGVG